jgi:hypothetical protein
VQPLAADYKRTRAVLDRFGIPNHAAMAFPSMTKSAFAYRRIVLYDDRRLPVKGSSLAERSSARDSDLRPYGQRTERCGQTFAKD